MCRYFLSIAMMFLSQSCVLVTPYLSDKASLPKHFRISKDFTVAEQIFIIQTANKWNNFISRHSNIEQALIYDGVDEREFDIDKLNDGTSTIYVDSLNVSERILGNVPIGGENIFISRKNIAMQSGLSTSDDLSQTLYFQIAVTHEMGHFIGITSHLIDDPTINPEQQRGVMASGIDFTTLEFTEQDIKLLCLVIDCIPNVGDK